MKHPCPTIDIHSLGRLSGPKLSQINLLIKSGAETFSSLPDTKSHRVPIRLLGASLLHLAPLTSLTATSLTAHAISNPCLPPLRTRRSRARFLFSSLLGQAPTAEMMGVRELPKRADLVEYNYAVAGQ
jgi:hypothetical protein